MISLSIHSFSFYYCAFICLSVYSTSNLSIFPLFIYQMDKQSCPSFSILQSIINYISAIHYIHNPLRFVPVDSTTASPRPLPPPGDLKLATCDNVRSTPTPPPYPCPGGAPSPPEDQPISNLLQVITYYY